MHLLADTGMRRARSAMHVIVDALESGDEAKAVGFIDSVTEADHLGFCLFAACETGYLKCTRLLLAAHAAVDRAVQPRLT